MSEVLRASHARELPRPNRTYGGGRVCAADGCETRLSIYNKADYCWTHVPHRFVLARGERRRRAA